MRLKGNTLKSLGLGILFLTTNLFYAQITTKELPPSLDVASNVESVAEIYHLPSPIIISSKNDSDSKSKPWEFGKLIPNDIGLESHGKWMDIDQNNMLWVFHLKSKDALSLNLNFDLFHLSENAKLFIYNEISKDYLGAITAANNKENLQFSTRPILGEELKLELYVPKSELEENQLHIHQIVYGYRNVNDKVNKAFNSSGRCNKNINCPEGNLWQDIKRSVVYITTVNNTSLCTGTLMNNVAQDSTPYILTASHCNVNSNSNFIFNYESPNPVCTNIRDTANGVLGNSISGASSKARGVSPNPSLDFTDFQLFQLSATPPLNYNVYYSGWSAVDEASTLSASIHHPSGDVKKISIDEDTTLSSGNNTLQANTHWMVRSWETGSTEGGSSGAALFDQNLRVIGQLQGGDAACGNNAQDYFGKVAVSWDSLTANNRQLKRWLDPNNTGTLILDGWDPNGSTHQRDIQILPIRGVPKYFCDTSFSPVFAIRNNGSDTLKSFKVLYWVDQNTKDSVNWTGNLNSKGIVEVQGNAVSTNAGSHQFNAEVDYDNGLVDQDQSNNLISIDFLSNQSSQTVNFRIKTDDFGIETSWVISMQNGNNLSLFKGGPYREVSGGETINRKMCIPDSSCLDLSLYDAFNDGFNGPFGNGNVLITDQIGDTLLFERNFTGSKKSLSFCTKNAATSIEEAKKINHDLKVYPNPVLRGSIVNLSTEADVNNVQVKLFDQTSRLVLSTNQLQFEIPEQINSGMYFIQLLNNENGDIKIKKLYVL